MAKIYYNDNGTWKVVDISGGGIDGGGSIDADTLNGLLSAGDGISIGKTTAGDKVKVKIDPSANIVGTTFEARDNPTSPVEYTKLRYTGVFEYHNPMFDYTFSLPATGDSGIYQLLASNYVKTLFGNQSIVGIGNIDLYVHNMTFTLPDGNCYGRWISSKNLNIDSLTDLKTVFGNTFKLPLFGDVPKSGGTAVMITETKLIMDELEWNYSDFTISDIVTTV